MAAATRQSVQQVHDEIVFFLSRDRSKFDAIRNVKIDALGRRFRELQAKIPRDVFQDPAVPPLTVQRNQSSWDQLPESDRRQLHQQLGEIRDAVLTLVRGPRASDVWMREDLASDGNIYFLGFFAAVVLGVLGTFVVMMWSDATNADKDTVANRTSGELRQTSEEMLQAVKLAEEKRKTAILLRENADLQQRQLVEMKLALSGDEASAPATDGDGDDGDASGDAPPDPGASPEQPATSAALQQLQDEFEAAASKAQTAEQLADSAEIQMRVVAAATGRSLSLQAGPNEWVVVVMCVMLGAIGGTLRLISSLVSYIGNRQLLTSWVPYYISMPFQGAILAPIVYLLLRVGILSPSVSGDSSTALLNLVSIYAFAALTGLFANQANVKLRDIFEEVFRSRPKSKDALAADGSAASTAATPTPARDAGQAS